MIKSQTPEISNTYAVAGVVYPTLDAMADDMYGLAFSGDHIPGSEYKYGELAGSISQLDTRWLEQQGQETDPAKRTRAYVDAVKQEAAARLKDASFVYFDRNALDEVFDIAHVGTPFDRDGITIHAHTDGYLLSHFGGGYAGDANLVRLSQRHADGTDDAYPVYKGLTTHYRFDSDGLTTIELPMRAIAEATEEAVTSLGFKPADIALDSLKKLWAPFTENRMKHGMFEVIDILSAPGTAEHINSVDDAQRGARVHLGDRFRSYDWHHPDNDEKIKTEDGRSVHTRWFTTHPAHKANTQDGTVTYGINPDAPAYGAHTSVAVELTVLPWNMQPTDVNRELNSRLKAAAAILRAPFEA